ncbi:MAG: M14 family metallopeptidase [Gemmatimonadales bacterium]
MRLRLLTTAVVLLAAPRVVTAQEFDFYARGPYRPQVPRPEQVLGYRIGSQQTMYHQQQGVLDRMIEAAPDRVRTEIIGRTAEGKVMRLLVISSPENLARLDEIRSSLARLADPRRTTAPEAKALAERTPVTVLLTHSVHGNEVAGFEAAMETVYQLLASEEPATLEILRNAVVLINPSQNPDGHERFAAWSNSVAMGSDDPMSLEHDEPWSVQGRYNHYRFDMNRDLLAQSQLESKALASVYVRWRPQVIADLHSTTATYFFPPVADAHNLNLPPRTYEWFERLGKNNAEAFDQRGWQYFVRETYDFFYPGYIDMWPSMRGGLGMTFETDGGGPLKRRKDDGSYVTLEMAIAHHYVASLATVQYAAAHRVERLNDFYDFHASAISEVAKRPLKRIVFSGADSARAFWLARRLATEEIEVTRLTQPWSALRATPYLGGAAGKRTFPAGSYVVDLAQPEGRLATTMLEVRAQFDSAFVRKQVNAWRRNQLRGPETPMEEYDFYDITGWSLPLTLGLDAWWSDEATPVTGTRVSVTDSLAVPPVPSRARSAYVFSNENEAGAKLAARLLREGYRVSAAARTMTADGVSYPRSTFVVRVQRNAPSVHERIAQLARETGARVVAVQSAFADTGAIGVGSESVRALRAPRILLAAGEGIDQTAFGAVWFYLERELGFVVVPVNLNSLDDASLDDYNVLIIPSGSAGRMARQLGEGGARHLKRWVESGGAVIGFGGAVSLLGRKELDLTTVRVLSPDSTAAKDSTVTDAMRPVPPLISPSAAGGNGPAFVFGSIFKATLDRTHWLTGGYERDQLPVLLETDAFLKPSERGANPVVFTGNDLTLAGFTWPGNTEKYLRNSVWAAVESPGSGSVILFAENPVYRGFWRGPAKLLTNAILFGPGR